MIVIKNLYKSYGSLKVLKDLNLEVYDGETLVILGRSGVGKSVLLKQIIGIEQPDSGSIVIDDVPMLTASRKEKAQIVKNMGMLFQGAALFDSMTIGENTAFYLRQHRPELSEEEIQKKVAETLEMVGLGGKQQMMPSDLSGGMRKRAALARVAIYEPRIVLYDEPTTGLDPITSQQINNLIITTQKKLKATSIVVTHDINSAIRIGDRLAFHHDGQILHVAPTEEFLKLNVPLLHRFFDNAILTQDVLDNPRHHAKKLET